MRSIGCGILYYLAPQLSAFAKIPPFLAPTILIATFTLVTLTLTALVCGRLWFHQQEMRRTLGPQYGSPYKKTIIMWHVSCFLIAVPSLRTLSFSQLKTGHKQVLQSSLYYFAACLCECPMQPKYLPVLKLIFIQCRPFHPY